MKSRTFHTIEYSAFKAVLTCILTVYCIEANGQYKGNDPQRADAKIALKKSVSWSSILADDNTGLKHIGNITAPEKGTDKYDFWSIGCETMDRDYSFLPSYKQYLSELGAGYGRLMSGWAKTEKVKGQYNFEWLDEHVDGLAEEGVKPWMCLCYGNELYSGTGTLLFSQIITGEETLAAWERYVEALVQRYKGRIHMYEIWNEPNYGGIYKTPGLKEVTYSRYAELVYRTLRAIRKYDKKVAIAAGSLASYLDFDFCMSFLDFLKERGLQKEVDYITFHPYGSIPERRLDEIVDLQKSLKQSVPWISLLQGEVGIRGLFDTFGQDLKNNEFAQDKWVLRQMAMEFGLGIPCSIFSMIDNKYPHKLQSYGMLAADLQGRSLYKRPQFYGYQNMVSVLDKEVKAGPALDVDIDAEKQLYHISITGKGKIKGIMLWFGNEKPGNSSIKDRVGVKVAGLKLKNPVYADMITGRVFELADFQVTSEGMEFHNLPLWDAPVLIMEANAFRWTSVAPEKSFKKAAPKTAAPVKKVTPICPGK